MNLSDITRIKDSIYMIYNDIQNVQFHENNQKTNEKVTLSIRRVRRRFFTRTTGALIKTGRRTEGQDGGGLEGQDDLQDQGWL